jgi:hypothetical protein
MTAENTGNQHGDQEQQLFGKNISDLTLCYLICPQDAANAFLGALMITDYRTRPLHFAYATPVRPSKIQKLLYGSTLDEHIKIDVISNKLLQGVPRVPDVLFVDTKELLTVRRLSKKPTAVLSKSTESPNDPSKLTMLQYDTGSNLSDQDAVGQLISGLENFIDLVEPFARMREAVKEAGKATGA